MSLDFGHTCPDIDAGIDGVKVMIQDYIYERIREICPALPEELAEEMAKEDTGYIYDELEDSFESVRSTNEEMRSVANSQIAELEDIIDELEHENKEINAELEDLRVVAV